MSFARAFQRRQHFPEIRKDFELNADGWFSVVIPEGRENLIKNPSLETNSNGYVAVGGTIARSAAWQSHGAVSLQVTPTAGVNDGMYYDDPSHDFDVAENTLYWPSFDFKADGGRKYKAYVARAFSGTQLGAAFPFTATGHSQRIQFPYQEGDNTLVDSLTAYWKLGEATGATRLDSVGTSHLTPLGGANPGPSQTTGIINNAALFTRANSEYLNVADTAALSVGDVDFSLSLWVKTTSEPGTMGIIAKGTGDTAATLEYRLLYNQVTDRFNWLVSNGVAATTVASDAFGALTPGTWYHIVCWHDSVNNVIGIRINDSAQNTAAHTVGCVDGAGAFKIGTTGAVANFLDATVDEVGFWKKVLSSTEITTLYNSGFSSTYPFLYRRLYIVKDNETNTRPFYVDGLQFEAGEFPTTYADGDMVGLVPNFDDYYWTGTPHASTSVRVANSADGGRVMNLKQLGLKVISFVGAGMILSPVFTPLGNGGAFYQGTTVKDRGFTIVGEINGGDYQELDMYEQALVDAFSPNRCSPQQPIKVLYQPLDDCGNSIGETLEMALVPDGDFLPMQTDNLNARRLALPFRLYLPFVANNADDQGLIMQYQTAVQMSGMVRRMSDGTWDNLNGPTPAVAGNISVMKWGPDGRLYAGGSYTSIGGVSINGIGYYDPGDDAWHAMGTGQTTGDVFAITFGADGKVYVGGSYTSMGGVANTSRIAYWDGSAWNAMGTGAANNSVFALVAGLNGVIYATGNFTGMGGIANTNFIAQWSGTAWSAMGTGLVAGAGGRTLSVGLNGYIFVGGNFASASAVANTLNIAYWNPTAASWNSLGTGGANNDVYSSAVTTSGEVFFGGTYTVIGGQSINRISRYNGASFFAMGTGAPAGIVQTLVYNQFDNLLYIAGTYTSLGGLTPVDSIMAWNGSSFVWTDFELPATAAVVSSFAVGPDQSITANFNAFGIGTPGYVQTVTNNGTDTSWPTLVLRGGSARVFQIVNRRTGASIYFNLTLNNGEVATLTLSPSGATFNSTYNGNILGTILPGSNTAGFNLLPGDNPIELFMTYSDVETGDNGAQLTAYSLQGVNTTNSDSGTLYVNIVNLGGSNRRVDFYQDSARTQLVAQTGTYAATGIQTVTQANSSGITGTVVVTAVGAADIDIVIVVPVSRMYWSPDYASLSGAVRPRVF